ncbi:Leucine rich repeat-containing protein [Lachnospiraceae bacterium XPB1003]|nr:Leucine rich repeat-containing protein [Lachnospiraceae bacterium XPB1003]
MAILFLLVYFIFPIKFQTKDYTAILCVDGLGLKKYRGEEKDVKIPNFIGVFPVISIQGGCFKDNETIETVVIPNNVKYIGAFAFEECVNLKSVEASRIKVIGEYAFSGDIKLEKVELGDNVQTIERLAFAECHALTYIPSRSSLKEIGGGAFAECEIDDPGDLTGIMVDEYVFLDCPWSESPNNPASANYVDPEEDSAE